MALSKGMQEALNEQVKHEMFSSHLYLSMVTWLEANNWPGFANWMKVQAKEETSHAMKFFNHIFDRGGRVTLQALEKPQSEFKSPLDIFEKALDHEKFITGSINKLNDMAIRENDYATSSMLKWFIDEQVEEEKNAQKNVDDLRRAGDHLGGLLILDKNAKKRE